ncbi:hypothetical protein QNI23_013730 [Bermanella sp. WJH001]|uniref:hypothetical protein n=1 Tax=Bermanella sp. WJH001 TaxID=3048005 RepID=UPI0024BE9B79|nr:hypothetical protein [Bermanella sp. WJH001]MDJ1538052.1 hypothetical protein [Bermanella sp. WJH001]
MLLRSLFLLMFSSQVLSAGITIDVDLNMTIDAIKYIEQESDDTNLYAYLDIIEECPELPTSQAVAETNNADLNTFLNASGFTLATEKATFDGSNLENFQFHQDGTWTVYDDINRKLVRNWDEDCPNAPRAIHFDSNYENVHTVGIAKELDMAYFNSDTDGGVFDLAEEVENNLAWLDEKPEGEIKDLLWVGDVLFAHMVGGINTGIWQVKPQWQKKMNTSLSATADVIHTESGLMGVSKESSLKVQWLEQNKGHTYTFNASGVREYHAYPFVNGTVLVAESESNWKFQWIKFGEKEQIVTFPKPVHDLMACRNSDNYLFCFDRRDTGDVFVWRMMIPLFGFPVFVLDSKFSADLLSEGSEILAVQVSNTHRLITIKNAEEVGLLKVGSTDSAYSSINDLAISTKLSATKQAHVYLSESQLNILTVNQQAVSPFLPYLVSQSEVFEELDKLEGEKEVEVTPQEPVEEVLEEREETADENEEPIPRAEISGALSPYYLFALMLLLIVGRRKAKN